VAGVKKQHITHCVIPAVVVAMFALVSAPSSSAQPLQPGSHSEPVAVTSDDQLYAVRTVTPHDPVVLSSESSGAEVFEADADPSTDTRHSLPVVYAPRHPQCAPYLELALEVGWPAWALSHIEPVMWRESRCTERAQLTNTNGTVDRGLMQVNSSNGEMLKKAGVIVSLDELFNPRTNLRAARELFAFWGGSFCPWQPPKYCA
jgi:hypothetical protein